MMQPTHWSCPKCGRAWKSPTRGSAPIRIADSCGVDLSPLFGPLEVIAGIEAMRARMLVAVVDIEGDSVAAAVAAATPTAGELAIEVFKVSS